MLTFRLIQKCWQDASAYENTDVDFLLEENNWNDFGYYTTYHLHVTNKHVTHIKGAVYLGSIHIMKLGQKEGEIDLLRTDLAGNEIFHELPRGFYSITFSIDVYKGLARYLTEDERAKFISSFRLILKENDTYYSRVKEEPCFTTSMLRGGDMESYSLLKGRSLLLQEGIQYNLRKKKVTIKYSDSNTPVVLDFSAISGLDSDLLPNGMIAFIGKNGSGKSTALYKLASLLYTDPSDRNRYLSKIGTIEPTDLGIAQLMIFSYSPFDNFILPGENVDSDLMLWARNIEEHEGRFVFCGLRDVKREAEKLLDEKKYNNEEQKLFRRKNIYLKEQIALAKESWDAYNVINSDANKQNEWEKCLNDMKQRQPELYQNTIILYNSVFDDCYTAWEDIFQSISTGHKFFFHSLLHIIAYCEENAMLLFDEPENHLQAPLLSFMLSEVRTILTKRNSVMLIATHSPVILQETLSKNVRIVRREGENIAFAKPSIETFGENFGTISAEVFDLTTDRVQFFNAVDEIYDTFNCDEAESLQQAIDVVKEKMNGISSQIIQYVVSKYINGKHK